MSLLLDALGRANSSAPPQKADHNETVDTSPLPHVNIHPASKQAQTLLELSETRKRPGWWIIGTALSLVTAVGFSISWWWLHSFSSTQSPVAWSQPSNHFTPVTPITVAQETHLDPPDESSISAIPENHTEHQTIKHRPTAPELAILEVDTAPIVSTPAAISTDSWPTAAVLPDTPQTLPEASTPSSWPQLPRDARIEIHRSATPSNAAPSRTPDRTGSATPQAYRLLQEGRWQEALAAYQSLLVVHPDHPDFRLGLALSLTQLDRASEAIPHYHTVLRLDPDNAVAIAALVGLGAIETRTGESRLRHVLAQQPNEPALWQSLGQSLSQQQRWSEAQEAFFRAHTLAPESPDIAHNLAVSLDQLGQRTAALRFYQIAVNLSQRTPATFDLAAAEWRIHTLYLMEENMR